MKPSTVLRLTTGSFATVSFISPDLEATEIISFEYYDEQKNRFEKISFGRHAYLVRKLTIVSPVTTPGSTGENTRLTLLLVNENPYCLTQSNWVPQSLLDKITGNTVLINGIPYRLQLLNRADSFSKTVQLIQMVFDPL